MLEIDKSVYDQDDPRMAIDSNNLGTVLLKLGELQEAKKYFERALQIDERIFGPDDPEVARNVNNLGMVMKDLEICGKPGRASREL